MSGKPQPPAEKRNKNPRHGNQVEKIDYFETIYGDGEDFDENLIPKFSPRYAGYGNPALRSLTNLPLAPAPVNLEKTRKVMEESKEHAVKSSVDLPSMRKNKQQTNIKKGQVPVLTIPKKHTTKVPISARPAVLAPLVPTEEITIQTPRAANDNLALFDETDFDSTEYDEEIKRRLSEGPIPAMSLFMVGEGTYEWKPCTVISISGNSYTIRWNDSGKTKVVQRLSVRLESDDPSRFEQRRELAVKNREETVQTIKLQAYLQARSTENFVQQEPKMMEDIIKLLPRKICTSKLIPGLVQEINSLYSYSHTLREYEEEWKDPEKAEKFKAEGLLEVKSSFKPLKGVMKLKNNSINSIQLADYQALLGSNDELVKYKNDPIVDRCIKMLPKTVSFSYFLTEVLDELQDKHQFAEDFLVPNLGHLLSKMIISNESKVDQFCNMMNLRLNHAVGTLIINLLTEMVPLLKKNGIHFRLTAMSDLETFVPSRSSLEIVGVTYINMFADLFNEKKLKKLTYDLFKVEYLPISHPFLEESRNTGINNWMNMIKDSFDEIQQYIDDIRETTAAIPLDPMEECIKILPSDFEAFIKKGEMPTVDSREINLDLVHQKLRNALNAYSAFTLKFVPKRNFGIFNTDLTKFFALIEEKKNTFYSLIFKYMNAQTDKQVNLIGGMIETLINRTTCAPGTVEEWYDKHIILVHIMAHVGDIQATLDYLLVMMNFMSEFLFEPEQSFKATYKIKNNLHKIVLSINELNHKDNEEKEYFIKVHKKEIEEIQAQLKEFQTFILTYNRKDVNTNSKEVRKTLLADKKNFDKLTETCKLYKSRDEKLELPITEYPIIEEIESDFNLYIPAWDISTKIDVDAQHWLGTIFRQLDVQLITETVIQWEKTVRGLIKDIDTIKTTERHKDFLVDGKHPLEKAYDTLLHRVQFFIMHLPIIKYLCNPFLRLRHWKNIVDATNIQIGPNDGVTWNWLIEIGIEENIVEIASISKSADNEAKIERAITEMCEDLTNISFKIEKTEQGIKLKDPSTALLILSKHQQIMQEIFVPPYIQPFISKVKEYEILAANVRQILKQSIETEERINELTPAMESTDLRTQHEDMTTMFENKVTDFKKFAESFKLSATFHMILNNQTTTDICNDISEDIIKLKHQLQDVLEEKRKAFPRFRLLSDSQLIYVISNSEDPSAIADMFSMMYPAIKTAVFENNNYCLGFNSFGGEYFEFVNKVRVTPACIEGWFKDFDNQITYTLKTLGRKIMQSPISNIEKMALTYPSQLLTLVFEITFTSNVNKCFASFENNFTEYARPKLIEQLNIVLDAINTDLEVLSAAYKKTNSVQISNMIIVSMNHKSILQEILDKNVGSPQDPVWLSTPKYTVRNIQDFTVDVTVGSCTHPYGFEYSGNNFPIILTQDMRKFFSQMMNCTCGGALPLACGWSADRKSNYIIQFLNAIGKQPFVYPCHYHTSLDRMQEFITHAAECNAYVIFKDIYSLKFSVLSDFATELVAMKNNMPTHIFATYTYGQNKSMHVPEILKLAFRPVDITNFGYSQRFEVILAAMGTNSPELAAKLSNLVKTITKAFKEPLSAAFSFLSLIQLVQSAPILSNDPCHEIHKRIIDYTVKRFGEIQSEQLIKYVDAVFEEKSNINVEVTNIKMHEDPSINDRLISLYDSLSMHYGVIISGPSLCGKSALIRMYCKHFGLTPKFINPLSIDLADLYGDKDSGVLSSILQKSDTVVFDGPCDPTWMETLTLGISQGRRMHFGDGSMLNLRDKVRFIIETTDMSHASPAILARCGTIYLGPTFFSTKIRVDHFIEKISKDQNLIEPISQTIVSSQVSVNDLTTLLNKVIMFFMDYVDDNKPLTNCLKFLRSLIYNYYLPSMDSSHVHHTATQLIENIPKLVLFAMYWSWAGRVVNDDREKFDVKFTQAAEKYGIDLKGHKISEIFFDTVTNDWVTWANMDSARIIGDPLKLIDREPKHLLFDPSTFKPIAYIARELFSRGNHLLLACHPDVDQSVIANIIQHMPYIMDHFSPKAYMFGKDANHKLLREMLSSVLPETKGKSSGHSVALRIPLLSVLGFHSNQRSTSSELIRFIINHREIPSEFGVLNEPISGLTLLMCGDENALNTRVSSHAFSIAIPRMTEAAEKHAVSEAVRALWGINNEEVGSVLLDLLNNVKSIFKFSIYHLFTVLQRVGVIMVNHDPNHLVDVLAYQCVNVFYDAYHDEKILANISVATRDVSKALNLDNQTDVFEIAGKCVLSNINSPIYRQVACFGDLVKKKTKRSGRRVSLIRFTSSDNFEDAENEIHYLRGIDDTLRLDIIAVLNTITTPKCHIKIYTEIPKLSHKIIETATSISKSVMCEKQLYIPLMQSFHDVFLEAGKTRVHHVLFIDENTLTKDDIIILDLLLKTTNVYGLFSRNELLNLMTSVYEKKGVCVDPFKEDSLETQKDYNTLVADFITDCEMYFHFAVVSLHPATPNTNCQYTSVYTPFFGASKFISSCIENEFNNLVSFESSLCIKHHFVLDTIKKLSESPLIRKYSYLISAQNLSHIITDFVAKQNRKHDELQGKLKNISDLMNVNSQIKKFMDDQSKKMTDMENQLLELNKQLTESTAELEKINQATEVEMVNANRESAVLKEEKAKAEKLRREITQELKATNAILETATAGIKNIKASDIAIIKNMHQPPKGVVLVIMALCVILGQPININASTDEDFAKILNTGRIIMGDVSFLKKITNAVHDSLSQPILDALRKIIADPNFEPSAIERSSSAARSICIFIRAIIPYSEAIETHKAREKVAEEVQENLERLEKKYNEALEKFNKCQKEQLTTKEQIDKMNRQIERVKNSIQTQNNKIEDYKLFQKVINNYIDRISEEYECVKNEAERSEAISFLKAVYSAVAGPFNEEERNQIFDLIKFHDFTRNDLISTDEPLVAKWQRTEMPVSWHWQENTSFFSPENGRWVICENAHMLSTNYLKTVINRQSVNFISALSPTFDDDFVASISSQVGIVVYDFDFINPNLVVPVVCRARETGTPFVYNGETINVPKDFFVVFDCKELPTYYSIGMDVELVRFDIDNRANAEQIALKSFQLVFGEKYTNSIKYDTKILATQQTIDEIKENLRTMLINAGPTIFSNSKLQTDFKVYMQQIEDNFTLLENLKKQHKQSYEQFEDIHMLARKIVNEYQSYPVTSSLWKMFEGAFSQSSGIRFEDYEETVRNVMVPYLASIVPEGTRSNEAISMQSMEVIAKQSRSVRPIVIVSRDSSFPFNALFNIYKERKLVITTPSKSKQVVTSKIQLGTPVCVVCTTQDSMIDILGSVSKNLDANFVSGEFRLFICVLGSEISLSSALLTKADVIYFDHPSTVEAITRATQFGLKKDIILSGITQIDAEISIANRQRYNARVHCFEDAQLSLQCVNILTAKNKEHVFDFIKDYLYTNGRVEEKKESHVVECNESGSCIDFSTVNPDVFIESQKVEYALTEGKCVSDLVAFIDLEGKDHGQEIGNIEILGNVGNKVIKYPTFSIKHKSKSMKPAPLYTEGKRITTLYVTNDSPIEIVTLQKRF